MFSRPVREFWKPTPIERREIEFSKGYIVFEETYRAFAERFKLKRREFGYLVVITYDK